MRKLMRSIARERMKAAGLSGFNRKKVIYVGKNSKPVKHSYFAENWRKWITGNPLMKKKRRRSTGMAN